jgi:hypothetical protein
MKSYKEILEKKSDYQIYHNTYTAAMQEVEKFVKKNGFTLDDESDPENIGAQQFDKVGMGPRKPTKGKTNKFTFDLYKNNKKTKKYLQVQVYGDERFELNMYFG